MVRALESLSPDPSHLEFFGLTRPPFVRLSQTSEIFHTEQYSLLMAHLASATEQPDCLVVICGTNGSGKTTLLNRYIASLSNDVSYASIDETCNGEMEFYRALLRQLGFSDITGTARELRRIAKEFLVHRGMAGDPVLMMIDNAHLINPKVFEQLRWISAIKVKDRRVLSVVLAGNSDLARIMDSPAMSQTKFDSHVRFSIRAYSEVETGDYISHRLKSVGGSDAVRFSNEVVPLIYSYTGGVPSLINMLCNAVLTEANALKSRDITEELVRAVADNRRLLPHVVPLQGKGRRKSDPDFKLVQPDGQTEERITARELTTKEPVEIPTLRTGVSDIDDKGLVAQNTQLSVELGELGASRMRALKDIRRRDLEVGKLREKLNAQTAKTKKLASALGDKTDEIEQLNQALSDDKLALQKNEKASRKLTTDLEKARSAKKAAQSASANAKTKAQALSDLTSELQATVSGLNVDVKLADQRAVEIDALEKNVAALKDEVEKKSGELLTLRGDLDSRDEALGGLEKQFEDSENECATLRLRATALKDLEECVSEKETQIAVLKIELDSDNEQIKALEAKNEELESRDMELVQADTISSLESELQEVSQILTETQAQLAENAALVALSNTDACDSPKPEKQQAEHSLGSKADSTAAIKTLEIVTGGEIQQVVEVAESQSRIMIGRADDCDLCLNSGFVSRHHALISRSKQGLYIENLNSINGTIVNSRKTTRCDLRVGDVVEIGDFQIRPRSGITG